MDIKKELERLENNQKIEVVLEKKLEIISIFLKYYKRNMSKINKKFYSKQIEKLKKLRKSIRKQLIEL